MRHLLKKGVIGYYKRYSLIRAFGSFYKRHSKKLIVNRQMIRSLTASRLKGVFLTVNRQRDSPPHWDPLKGVEVNLYDWDKQQKINSMFNRYNRGLASKHECFWTIEDAWIWRTYMVSVFPICSPFLLHSIKTMKTSPLIHKKSSDLSQYSRVTLWKILASRTLRLLCDQV